MQKFSRYGNVVSVKVHYKYPDRMAFVNFTNCEDAKRAGQATTGLVWENLRVVIEP